MNKSALLHMMHHVSALTDQDVEELEKLVKNFPYCQTAHLLIAKASYDKGNMLSNQKLRKAAAYATNRHLLKKLIYTSDSSISLAEIKEHETSDIKAEAPIATHPNLLISSTADVLHEVPETSNEMDVENAELAPENTGLNNDVPIHSAIVPEEESLVSSTEDAVLKTVEEEKEEEIIEEVISGEESDALIPELVVFSNDDSLVEEEALLIGPKPEDISLLKPANSFTPAEVDELLQVDHWKTNFSQTVNGASITFEPIVPEQPSETSINTPEPAEIIRYELDVPEEMEESSLDLTLVNFDSYLFKPEWDEFIPGELKAATNEEFIREVYLSNQVGYWMGSSRLGELLQVKDEVTRHTPLQFYPDLILEYSKQNYLTPTNPPKVTTVSRQFEIIDQFLKSNPKLKTFSNEKVRSEPHDDLAFKSTKNTKNLASENLANILIQQGKLKKAIKIYEHLIVKIPEKKAYFASQIENLRNQL
ncbi:hypothetical protein AHMF7605_06290 [Adhaeribacter arboris]|uniref:Tetratricopeptide repeat protein n=1 Tax=Adhaeribacter arboris TaxID=2072846 RepID=A0A2T2YCC2_9BACT|nr:hypothetical protein [Adhaeribacter arboris]PSR53165.1 hypothetical protein AHMF7605_06290 [Adhaeribacter arboris]